VGGALTVLLTRCAQGVEEAPPNLQRDAGGSTDGKATGAGSDMGAAGSIAGTGGSGGTSTNNSGTGGSVGEDASGGAVGDDASIDAIADAGHVDDAGGNGSDGASMDAGPQGPLPILHYEFDETVGSVVTDSSGNNHNGMTNGGYSWVAGKKGNAVKLDGLTGFVSLPAGIVSGLSDMTLATWVQLEVAADWQRIIDFGNNNTVQMFLVPQNKETAVMRFVITTTGKPGQQLINGPSPLPVGVWKHVAVVLNGATWQLYVDGTSVAMVGGLTLHPSSMGSTANNWIGRSQLAQDPYFKGMFDDFRIYDRALTAAEIVAIVNN
jgi:Concanavalin A-like lectin/glucanases superfamily